jgi:hypothetical protein
VTVAPNKPLGFFYIDTNGMLKHSNSENDGLTWAVPHHVYPQTMTNTAFFIRIKFSAQHAVVVFNDSNSNEIIVTRAIVSGICESRTIDITSSPFMTGTKPTAIEFGGYLYVAYASTNTNYCVLTLPISNITGGVINIQDIPVTTTVLNVCDMCLVYNTCYLFLNNGIELQTYAADIISINFNFIGTANSSISDGDILRVIQTTPELNNLLVVQINVNGGFTVYYPSIDVTKSFERFDNTLPIESVDHKIAVVWSNSSSTLRFITRDCSSGRLFSAFAFDIFKREIISTFQLFRSELYDFIFDIIGFEDDSFYCYMYCNEDFSKSGYVKFEKTAVDVNYVLFD